MLPVSRSMHGQQAFMIAFGMLSSATALCGAASSDGILETLLPMSFMLTVAQLFSTFVGTLVWLM